MSQFTSLHRTDAIKLRNYGRILQDLVAYAITITDEQTRHAATVYIARCMRQKNQIWNKDFESGVERLREDIEILSGGKLDTTFPEFEQELARPMDVGQPKKINQKRQYKK